MPETYFLHVTGTDSLVFLDGLATQDMQNLDTSQVHYTLFLDRTGHILASCMIWMVHDEDVFLEVTNKTIAESLQKHLTRYLLGADCKITLCTRLELLFPEKTFSDPVVQKSLWRDPRYAGYFASFVSSDDLQVSQDKTKLAKLRARRVVENSPNPGDLPTGFLGTEVGDIKDFVSLTKGCYLGQETVARVHYRGKTHRSRYVVTLSSYPDHVPVKITNTDGREVGLLTSAEALDNNAAVGMAILRNDHAQEVLCLADQMITVVVR